jgi:hypothetical protein
MFTPKGVGTMFSLKATLVAMTLMKPWRTGWSADRGVDFSLHAVTKAEPVPPPVGGDPVPAEPVSFIDEDQNALLAAADPARTGPAMVDVRREALSREIPETPGLRAWWSLSGKPSDT